MGGPWTYADDGHDTNSDGTDNGNGHYKVDHQRTWLQIITGTDVRRRLQHLGRRQLLHSRAR